MPPIDSSYGQPQMNPGGGGMGDLLQQFLQAAGQLPGQMMGPHAEMGNEALEQFMTGGARPDVMGAMPMLPPGAMAGMAGRLKSILGMGDDFVAQNPLRGAGGYQGQAPMAGSQGIPHTSPLPNPGAPQMPPPMGPAGAGYADDAAGLMRGNIPPQPGMADDFAAMGELRNPYGGAGNINMSQETSEYVGRMLQGGYHPQDIIGMSQGAGFNPSEVAAMLGM